MVVLSEFSLLMLNTIRSRRKTYQGTARIQTHKIEKYTKLNSLQLFIFVRECLDFSNEDIYEIQAILLPGMKTFPVIYLCSRTHLWTFINNTISYVYVTNHNELFEDAIREEELKSMK